MWQWLRELREILNEPPVCQSCEVLKTEISNMRRERDLLLQKVLNPPAEITPALAPEPLTTFTPRHKPWRMKQQELEMEDKIQAARIRKEFEERTASLENQLGVPNGVPTRKEEERGYDGRGLGESG